jgi:hypothetical protein
VILLVVGAGALVAAASGGSAPAGLPKGAIKVEVTGAPVSPPIKPGFLGLSVEYPSLIAYAGGDPKAPNPLFIRLLRDLAPDGSPVIRIGGDTTDWTWWPIAGTAKPPWARYLLTPRWIAVARAVAVAAGARLIPGINFEADSPGLAGAESGALLNGLGRNHIAAFELGNEPEVYGEIGWYRASAGLSVLGRPPSYGFRAYVGDFRAISSAVPNGVPLAGPALALTWPLATAGRFLSANPRVRIFTFHFYPLKRCYNPRSSPTYPTLGRLLSSWATAPPPGTALAVAAAHSRGAQVRVDEVNSVSCRGLRGLSDAFASALWVLNVLPRLAQAGVDGVNVHTLPHASYQPFAFSHSAGVERVSVKPVFYGMLLFARAAPAGARLLATSQPAVTGLQTWATRGPGKTIRVVMTNDSALRRLTLAVRPPASAGAASLERLTATGLTALWGVRLAGQAVGGSATLAGRRQKTIVQPLGGRYVVALPPASAALLTLRQP